MAIPFVKMHGLGNDYLYVDGYSAPKLSARADWPELARAMSDRHRGAGSDGVIVVTEADPAVKDDAGRPADVRMRMFNADGSESGMCGNGVRCVAKFAHDRLGFRASPVRVQTGLPGRHRVAAIELDVDNSRPRPVVRNATVDMGVPVLDSDAVPTRLGHSDASGKRVAIDVRIDAWPPGWPSDAADWGMAAGQGPRAARVTVVSMGNPHAVAFVPDAGTVPLERIGPLVEHWDVFPERVNLHVVTVENPSHARMRTWERGAGMTQACGTGACAVLVAGVLTGRLERAATLALPGGELGVRWDAGSGRVLMSGPAEDVFEGTWPERSDVENKTSIRVEPLLRTARLALRPYTQADAARLQLQMGDLRVSQGLATWAHPLPEGDATRRIARWVKSRVAGVACGWAIELHDGTCIGGCGVHLFPSQRTAAIGYHLTPEFWGRGYATEATQAIINFAFEHTDIVRLWAGFKPWNTQSGRVMVKCGMTHEGTSRNDVLLWNGEASDSVIYAITRQDWEARRAGGTLSA